MAWYDVARAILYVLWFVTAALVIKLLVTRRRWRYPLRGNGPMLWALLLIIGATEVSRARNIHLGHETPPPYLPSLFFMYLGTALILYWLWRQLELIPAWLRRHLPWRRTGADYTSEEQDRHAATR